MQSEIPLLPLRGQDVPVTMIDEVADFQEVAPEGPIILSRRIVTRTPQVPFSNRATRRAIAKKKGLLKGGTRFEPHKYFDN